MVLLASSPRISVLAFLVHIIFLLFCFWSSKSYGMHAWRICSRTLTHHFNFHQLCSFWYNLTKINIGLPMADGEPKFTEMSCIGRFNSVPHSLNVYGSKKSDNMNVNVACKNEKKNDFQFFFVLQNKANYFYKI